MARKTLNITLALFIVMAIGCVILYIFSPYHMQEDSGVSSLDTHIDIQVPADSVFRYLGNSANASDWSSFVDHITPLNADAVSDGYEGSQRRCFARADEMGMTWDEEIIRVEPNRRRVLTIFNLQNFTVKAEGLVTEQRYHPIDQHSVRLTFSLGFGDARPNWWDMVKMKLASYRIKAIFEANLANIKRICETAA